MHAHQASTVASRRCARGAREHGALTAQAVRMQPTRHRRHKSTVAILIGTVFKKKLWKHAVIVIIFNISKVLVENKIWKLLYLVHSLYSLWLPWPLIIWQKGQNSNVNLYQIWISSSSKEGQAHHMLRRFFNLRIYKKNHQIFFDNITRHFSAL